MTRNPKTTLWFVAIITLTLVAEGSANKIAFNRGNQNTMKLVVMDDTGGEATAIYSFGRFSGGSVPITVSPPGPGGTWVAFEDGDRDLGYGAALYRVRADGSGLIKVLCSEGTAIDGTPQGWVWDAQWSPTGTEILVQTDAPAGPEWTQLGLLPAGFAVGSGAVGAACDSDLLPIYGGSSGGGWVMEGTAAWNDDGTRIALFEFDSGGNVQLVILERQEGWEPTIVPTDIDFSGYWSWSPDWQRGGDLLAFSVPLGSPPKSANWLNWIDVTTGAWGYLNESGGRLDGHSPSWSPDGSQLVFSDDRGDLVKWTYPDGPTEDMGKGTQPDWQRDPMPFSCASDADCQDGNPCTEDLCDSVSGDCSNSPVAEGTLCGIYGWCTAGGFCFEPECGAGDLPHCDDGNECTIDQCISWECVFDPAPAGLGCSDGDDCTEDDRCDGSGSCIGDPIPGCGCLPKSASCTADSECCSGKCRGGRCR